MKKLVLIFLLFTSSVNGKEDSLKAINNFYLELSVGPGAISSGEGYFLNEFSLYFKNHFSFNPILKFYFKNKRLRSGIAFGTMLKPSGSWNYPYSIEAGFNLIAKNAYPQYLGPSIAYGNFIKGYGNLGQRFIKFGVDYYYKNFHVAANYQWIAFKDAPFRKGDDKTFNMYFEVGYAFNLESFKRKQN